MHQTTKTIHIPVLLDAVLKYLSPEQGQSYLDLTAGYGGHAGAVLELTQAPALLTLVDRDTDAIEVLRSLEGNGARLIHDDFFTASQRLHEEGAQYDMILADLGVSSLHLDKAERGFTFREHGPLDMRMDRRTSLTAEEIVNTYEAAELIRLFREYGEEPRAKRIAEAIIAARPLHDTAELADVVKQAVPAQLARKRIHPATRIFQALRIAVNEELSLLERSLPLWFDMLKPGGRLGIITFHSLEDRIVKQAFARMSGDRYDADFRPLTKKPVVADDTEIVTNPRSRSAKLRVVVKIKTKERG